MTKPGAYRTPGGYTLIEMMFATAISTVVSLVAMGALVEGMHLFQSNSTEMVARDKGSRAIRQISNDVRNAASVAIYSSTLCASATTYGPCAVITNTAGGMVAYYFYTPSVSNTNAGGIYYCANASLPMSHATDQVLAYSVQDFEFRSDISGTIRTGFKMGIYGYPTLLTGSKEPDLVRFTTSNLPRN